VQPSGFDFGVYGTGIVIYENLQSLIVPQVVALQLSPTDQGKLIDLACCKTCSANLRFNVQLTGGWQVDCLARTLTKLPDTCDDRRQALAFLNCWTEVVSSAPAASFGFAALVITALFVW
jgi:hypothetical protein